MEPSNLFLVNPIQSDFDIDLKDAFIVAKFINRHEFVSQKASQLLKDLVSVKMLINNQTTIISETHNNELEKALIVFYGRQEDAEFYKAAQARNLVKKLKAHTNGSIIYTVTNFLKWCLIQPDHSQQSFVTNPVGFADYINLCQETNKNFKQINSHLNEIYEKNLEILREVRNSNTISYQEINKDEVENDSITFKCSSKDSRSNKNCIDYHSLFNQRLAECRRNKNWVERVKDIQFEGLSKKCSKDVAKHSISGPADLSLFMRYLARRIYGVEAIAKKLMGRNGKGLRIDIREGDRQEVFCKEDERKLLNVISIIDENLFDDDTAWSVLVKVPINQAGRDAFKQLKKLQKEREEEAFINKKSKKTID